MRSLKLSFVLIILSITGLNAQLTVYPPLPENHLMSAKYSVNVKIGNDPFAVSYTYQYLVNIGTASNLNVNDPYNISNAANRNALTNNHWTTVSYGNNGQALTFEITSKTENISSCEVFPANYGYSATIENGKAYINVDANSKYIYCKINGNVMDPLFLFVDPLETNIPTASTSTVQYFGPGIHTIGEKWTIPTDKSEVYIAGGAYVKGTIYANNRSNIKIRGRGILSGEGYNYRSGASGIPWCAVMLDGSSATNQIVEGITSMKPIHFHILSRGELKTKNIKCFSYNNTTDGWGGGTGSTLDDSFFKVNDDVTKLYADNMVLRNIVCYHQTNTPIFEYGWGGQQAKNCLIDGLDIVEDRHVAAGGDQGGIIGWATADAGKVHSGHIFRNFRSDCIVNFIFHIDANNTCQFTCENWNLKGTKIKSTPGNGTNVTFKCVKIGNQFIAASEMNANTSASYTFKTDGCVNTSIEKTLKTKKKSIYPNPAKNSFKVEISEPTEVQLLALNGQLIKLYKLTNSLDKCDIFDVEKGTYLVKIPGPKSEYNQILIVE